jgi:hypothetical protein
VSIVPPSVAEAIVRFVVIVITSRGMKTPLAWAAGMANQLHASGADTSGIKSRGRSAAAGDHSAGPPVQT